jgi:Rhodopirellula transposase DDE domain
MLDPVELERVALVFSALQPVLNERTRRLAAAAQARALGRGGVTLVSAATGLARSTIGRGLRELAALEGTGGPAPADQRIRRPGGGSKPLVERDPTLVEDLEALVEPTTRGDPTSPLRWTCKSLARLAQELCQQGHRISARKVGDLLHALHYSLQATHKTREGGSHPDRNAQFEQINQQTKAFQARGQPVVSVDCKKKELVGDFANAGREWQPQGQPEAVRVHDFPDPQLGKAIPYGVYDVTTNSGWVSVGIDHDTAEFAVSTLRHWWSQMGVVRYPAASELLVMADAGGSNDYRSRLWKAALQQFADETGLSISVCHFPPGTSKWNKIEHRMFAHITLNWRGRPLQSHEVIVQLIGSTSTQTGLSIQAALDTNPYPIKKRVSDQEFARLHLEPADFHPEWNYTLRPRSPGALVPS